MERIKIVLAPNSCVFFEASACYYQMANLPPNKNSNMNTETKKSNDNISNENVEGACCANNSACCATEGEGTNNDKFKCCVTTTTTTTTSCCC